MCRHIVAPGLRWLRSCVQAYLVSVERQLQGCASVPLPDGVLHEFSQVGCQAGRAGLGRPPPHTHTHPTPHIKVSHLAPRPPPLPTPKSTWQRRLGGNSHSLPGEKRPARPAHSPHCPPPPHSASLNVMGPGRKTHALHSTLSLPPCLPAYAPNKAVDHSTALTRVLQC